ncbi:MAG: filamentous hemagglutinin N-terminal domain-containing protein [Nostocaceae cyanobacterium]|nr:filamentous hemagglutinin N-terminal domain-containing protein [Nostocaceae cyanobacterium]
MNTKWIPWLRYLPLVTLLTLSVTSTRVVAQIIPDGTLGNQNSVVTPINPQLERIDGGAIRGTNLFHSFQEFNIGVGKAAYFANPAIIRNIFSRVTGGNPSYLFGKLGVLGDANLYFLNPNGIIFGANSSLDIRGSFVGSTAKSWVFDDGQEFSATNAQQAPLLTINVQPLIGLELEGLEATRINSDGNLVVGKDLTLAAGNLELQGNLQAGENLTLQATDTVKIRDNVEKPFIAAAGNKLEIQGNQIVDIFALTNADSGLLSGGDMILRSANQVGGDARFTVGGSFRIENLQGNLGNFYSPYDPIILAVGDVSLGDYFGASLHILAGGSVTIGNVNIFSYDSTDNTINPENSTLFNSSNTIGELANVILSDGTTITIDGSTKPTLDIRAGIDWLSFEGGFPINTDTGFLFPRFNNTPTNANINVGKIDIFLPFSDGGRVLLSNQYRPNLDLSGNITVNEFINTKDFADGGAVTIDSRNQIFLADNVDTSSFRNFGRGGDVTLIAKDDISLNPGVSISSEGALGGNITFNSGGDISLVSSFIRNRSFNDKEEESIPTGGNINITANSLSLNEFSRLDASTEGFANAGNVNIDVTNTVRLDFSDILSVVNPAGVGNAGDINIKAGLLEVIDGSQFQTRIRGRGNGGDINIVVKDGVTFAGIRDGFSPFATTEVRNNAVGNAGNLNISVTNGSLEVRDDTRLITTTSGKGNVGKVKIDVRDNVIFDGSSIFATVESGAIGNGREIEITASSLNFTNSQLTADTAGVGNASSVNLNGNAITLQDTQIFTSARVGATGNAGKVTINGSDRLTLNNSEIFSDVETDAIGNGGDMQLSSLLLSVTNNSVISTSTDGMGDAGSVNITVGDAFSLHNSDIFTRVIRREGNQLTVNAGDVNINSGSISLIDESGINTSATAGGAGKVSLQADGAISLENSSTVFTSVLQGNGVGGDIFINAQSLSLVDNSTLGTTEGTADVSDTTGGRAGNIRVQTEEFVHLGNSSTISASSFNGFGGNILINTKKLSLENGSQIRASILFGNQPAGSLSVNASESVEVSGFANSLESGLFINNFGNGDAGTLKISTGRLIVKDGGRISTSSFAGGKGGNLEINADKFVRVQGTTANDINITSLATDGVKGGAGDIIINSPRLTVENGAEISAVTRGRGKGGIIEINAPESVEVIGTSAGSGENTSIIKTDNSGSLTGDAGDIKINTSELRVKDGGEISALTEGKGKGGTIKIDSERLFLNNQARITAITSKEGEAGRIILGGNILETSTGSQITTSTSGSAKAGDIILTITDNITLDGADSGIFANTTPNSTGNGGEINIDPTTFIIKDGAAITVNSQGEGIGGDITLEAGSLTLDNGLISATTRSNTGGNINLDVGELILMRRGSDISTTAGNEQFGGNGGNINIKTQFIVALPVEDSNISANAFLGNGGNVEINAQGLFGIQFREQPTSLSDITASSEFGLAGNVNINTPDVDPTRDLVKLPESASEVKISRGCQAGGGANTVKFYQIGSGGFTFSPDSLGNSEPFLDEDLIPLAPVGENSRESFTDSMTQKKGNNSISSVFSTHSLPCQRR